MTCCDHLTGDLVSPIGIGIGSFGARSFRRLEKAPISEAEHESNQQLAVSAICNVGGEIGSRRAAQPQQIFPAGEKISAFPRSKVKLLSRMLLRQRAKVLAVLWKAGWNFEKLGKQEPADGQ